MYGQSRGALFILKAVVYEGKFLPMVVDHYGIYDGHGHFFHNSPVNPTGAVERVSAEVFFGAALTGYSTLAAAIAGGKVVVHLARDHMHAESVIARARQRVGTVYDLVVNNCEHFARWCFEGEARSTQVRGAAKGFLGGIAAIVLGAFIVAAFAKSA